MVVKVRPDCRISRARASRAQRRGPRRVAPQLMRDTRPAQPASSRQRRPAEEVTVPSRSPRAAPAPAPVDAALRSGEQRVGEAQPLRPLAVALRRVEPPRAASPAHELAGVAKLAKPGFNPGRVAHMKKRTKASGGRGPHARRPPGEDGSSRSGSGRRPDSSGDGRGSRRTYQSHRRRLQGVDGSAQGARHVWPGTEWDSARRRNDGTNVPGPEIRSRDAKPRGDVCPAHSICSTSARQRTSMRSPDRPSRPVRADRLVAGKAGCRRNELRGVCSAGWPPLARIRSVSRRRASIVIRPTTNARCRWSGERALGSTTSRAHAPASRSRPRAGLCVALGLPTPSAAAAWASSSCARPAPQARREALRAPIDGADLGPCGAQAEARASRARESLEVSYKPARACGNGPRTRRIAWGPGIPPRSATRPRRDPTPRARRTHPSRRPRPRRARPEGRIDSDARPWPPPTALRTTAPRPRSRPRHHHA